MQLLIRKLTHWAYSGDTFVSRGRQRRMLQFVERVQPPYGARIIDFGGTEYNWGLFDHQFHVTLVNLPGPGVHKPGNARFSYLEGDACDLSQFADNSFDVVFSNSVIEHVGDEVKQQQFANEAIRLAPRHWIQTPSSRCPIEAHTGVPFYWSLPKSVRDRLHRGWQGKLPEWCEMIQETRVLNRRRMQVLFPESQLFIERRCGVEKSYAAYKSA